MYKTILSKLYGPSYTVNESLSLRNLFVFKSIYCDHYESCYGNMAKGFFPRFIKGCLLNLAFKLLLSYLNLNRKIKQGLLERSWRIVFQRNLQIINTGIFSALFGSLYKFLLCFLKHAVFNGERRKRRHFISGLVCGLILLPLCFTRPYRKALAIFAVALAFECLFKLIVTSK